MYSLAHVYPSERKDGLADQLQKVGSVAVITAPIKTDTKSEFTRVLSFLQKNSASVNSIEELIGENHMDLSLIVSVLASVGWNQNDDIFMPAELWKAKSTAAHKPINDMHDSTVILGHMIESYAVDKAGAPFHIGPSGSVSGNIDDADFDIEVAGVLYSGLEELSDRISEILTKAMAGEIFVSMEAWFPKFAYGLLDGNTGVTHVVERNENTAFLTKHLRIFGGSGVYQGHRVGRILQDFIFGGKGIVNEPANPESVIRLVANKTAAFENTDLEKLSEGGVEGMTEKEIQALKDKLEQAETGLQEKDKAIVELQAGADKVTELNGKIEEMTSTATESDEKLTALETKKAEIEKDLAETTERADKAESELSDIRKQEKGRERFAQLSEVRDVEDKEVTMAELAEMSDDEFIRLMKYAGPVKADAEETDKESNEEDDNVASASEALDNVDETNEADLQGGNETQEDVDAEGYLALAAGLFGRTVKNDK